MAKMLPLHSTSSHAAIERRARAIFHTLGQPLGCELDYWIQAEEEFMRWVAGRNEQRRPSRAGVRFVLDDVRS